MSNSIDNTRHTTIHAPPPAHALFDPLVAAVCDPEEVWQLTDEMLVAQAQWLPSTNPKSPKPKPV